MKGKTEKDLREKVVLALLTELANRGHVIICDNFFSSPKLFDCLLLHGFFYY